MFERKMLCSSRVESSESLLATEGQETKVFVLRGARAHGSSPPLELNRTTFAVACVRR